ncbi:hypothetical protein NC653_007329 [Populus alba x Populus x berolinensis]|uniref:Sulfotransferase n=1 Tax=Populus alba x Populus x berolinensis TaxID=444605 RepID=A0AAD6WDS2_9ROSI|nr:hypothetical protein NC653_007329 [Populus alba x Populus x berolinensis]
MISASGCRFVYVCRDPRGVVISTWHFVSRSTIYCQNHNLWKMCSRFFVKEVQPMERTLLGPEVARKN